MIESSKNNNPTLKSLGLSIQSTLTTSRQAKFVNYGKNSLITTKISW